MLKCFQKITPTSGLEWLLAHDPEMRSSAAPAIINLRGLVLRIAEFEDRSCGSVRLEMEASVDGGGLLDVLAAPQPEGEIERWRCVELQPEVELLLDLVREEGTAGLANKLHCSQRNVQQKLKKLFEEGMKVDLLSGEVA